jgi:hypothetical protein
MMSKNKGPFVSYTSEQIFSYEAMLYVIQIGRDILEVDGELFFIKKNANSYYNKILKEILIDYHEGNLKERNRAKNILLNFKILPLRIH